MAKKLGDAFVRVRPDTSTFQAESKNRIGPALGKVIKGVGVAAGAVLGISLAKGFARLNAIDQATAKLRGLGNSAVQVRKIMDNALTSVRGTAFGLDEAATVSAGAVAAGIKPGRELTKTLKLVADAATIGGTSMSDMGAIFNKVAASNKIQGDVIAQLSDKGIPIIKMLSKTLGVSAAQVVDLASKGRINFAQFQAAMQGGLGGAAKNSATTFTGAWKNMMASVSRIGAGLLGGTGGKGGIFGQLAPSIRGITAAMAPLETSSGKLGTTIGRALVPVFQKLPGLVTKVVNGMQGFDLGAMLSKIGSSTSRVGPALKQLGAAFASIDFSKLGGAAANSAADTITVFAVVVRAAAKHTDLLAKTMPALIAAFAAYKAAQAASQLAAVAAVPTNLANAASRVILARAIQQQTASQAASIFAEDASTGSRIANTVATIASTVAQKAAMLATKAWAAGQWLLNAALTANPIGLVVVAVAALVAGVILAYKHSERFRAIVNSAFAAMKAVVSAVLPVVATVIRTYFRIYFTIIKTAFLLIRGAVVGAWGLISRVVRRGVALVRAYIAGVSVIVGIVRRAFGAVVSAISGRVQAAVAVTRGILGRIRNALSGAKNLLTRIGGQIIGGLTAGIRNAAQKVADAVSAIVRRIPKKIRQLMGIASPSRVMSALGRWLPAGLAQGIHAGGPAVDQAVNRLSQRITARAAAQMAIPTVDVSQGRARARDLDSSGGGPTGGGANALKDLAALLDGLGLELVVGDEKFAAWVRARADESVDDSRGVDAHYARRGARR